MSKSHVRINDLARELGIKSRRLLEFLNKNGVRSYKHASSVNPSLAAELRAKFMDPPRKSEREIRIGQGLIRPRAGGGSGSASTLISAQAPRPRAKKKKTAEKVRCRYCGDHVPRTEFKAHFLKHQGKTQQAVKRAKICPGQKRTSPEIPFNFIFPPMPKSAPPLPHEERCPTCHLLVHPAAMEQHRLDRHARPKLPGIETAQFSFIILPAGYDWDYRTVFEHYRRLSRSRNFDHNGIDWTRIEKIQEHLKPKLRSFGVRGWLGYAVYEFPYTERIVLECPIEGNATYILWGDWENGIRLSKGELRHKYSDEHIRVIHQGDWIGHLGRALRNW